MPLIPVDSREVMPRWRFEPCWKAESSVFTNLGPRYGYTRSQAEFRMRLAIVLHVIVGEHPWIDPRQDNRKARSDGPTPTGRRLLPILAGGLRLMVVAFRGLPGRGGFRDPR